MNRERLVEVLEEFVAFAGWHHDGEWSYWLREKQRVAENYQTLKSDPLKYAARLAYNRAAHAARTATKEQRAEVARNSRERYHARKRSTP